MQGVKKMEGMFSWLPPTFFGNASFLLTNFHYFHNKGYRGSRHYSIEPYQPNQKMACCSGPHSLWFLGSPHCTSFQSILVQSWLHTVCPFHYYPFTLMSDMISSLLICRVYVWAHLEYWPAVSSVRFELPGHFPSTDWQELLHFLHQTSPGVWPNK